MRSHTRRHVYGFLHHLLLAATISAVLVLLHATIVYRALDLATHYVIASLVDSAARSKIPPGEYPTVLILMPEVSYDTGRLATLVRTVTAGWRAPAEAHLRRVLVLAMDLSPLRDDTSDAERRRQKDLDDALDGAVRGGIGVVLGEPFLGPKPHPRDAERLAWIVERCAAGIHFGVLGEQDPTRPVHSVATNVPSAGVLAARLRGLTVSGEGPFSVCGAARDASGDVGRFLAPARPRPDAPYASPLNAEYFSHRDNVQTIESVVPIEGGVALDVRRDLIDAPPAVFVGFADPVRGTFGGRQVALAEIAAMEFFTARYPVAAFRPWAAFGLDVVLGIALGHAFAFLWEQYARAARRVEGIRRIRDARKWAWYLVARVLLAGNISVLALSLWGVVVLSQGVLALGLWLNPLPIILGTCIDGLLHSRPRLDSVEPETIRQFVSKHLDVVGQVLVIVWALAKLTLMHE